MAGIWRTLARPGIFTPQNACSRLPDKLYVHVRLISTSKKKKDTISVEVQPMEKSEQFKKYKEHFENITPDVIKTQKWRGYGYHDSDRELDSFIKNVTYFIGISICLVTIPLYVKYRAPARLQDWAIREAYLELNRRERLGLPLIDQHYTRPENMVLPSEEELGSTKIII